MEFHEAANALFERKGPPELGSERTAALLHDLGDPQEDLRAVQVAGTNGKGSTARMVERVLREAGLDVGLFTSPHLDDVRESIQVDGRKVTKAAVTNFVERVVDDVLDRTAAGEGPTFFELLTALACHEFARQDVDLAVFEVGMGGARDATSVVDPVASAVTTVDVDHAAFLGSDVEAVASELAGVAPADGPLVTAVTGDALAVVESETDDVVTVGEDADVSVSYEGIDGVEGVATFDGPGWRVETNLGMPGAHQARNAGVAAALVRAVAQVSDADLARGLRNAVLPGRFEVLGREPLVVLDGAHNPAACERVAETLSSFDYDDLHLVVGAMADKDLAGIAAALPAPDAVVACRADRDRAADERVIARAFECARPDAPVETTRDVASAFASALSTADPDDCVLATGSLAVVAEARTRWTRPTITKRVENAADARAVLADADVTDADVRETSAEAVHRVLETRVPPRQARRLRETMLALGGECAVAAVDDPDENRDVVTMGTLAQFDRLADRLADGDDGFAPLAAEIRDALDGGGASGRRSGTDDDRQRTSRRTDSDGCDYPWTDGTAVMGILNATPDSFHDGGEYDAVEAAVARAEEMVAAGADIVDVGGESTRPGADPVPVEEERSRVVPVVEAISDLDVWISIDTRKAVVARAALDAGADVLNDQSGLADPEMRLLAGEYDAPVVVMHSVDVPVDPDRDVEYDDVVEDVIDQLTERVLLAEKAGLDREQIVVDPGIGFGKTPAEEFELLGRADEFAALGCPVLIGHSHKSLFGRVDRAPGERYEATVAATAVAAERGADVVRVHDVEANATAVDVVAAARDPDAFGDDS
ncbi:MAG: dihydropteroate synthase [Haloarculaceae archaeon]